MAHYKSGNLFQIILELSKVRITIAVAFSTITGYIASGHRYDAGFIVPTLGIFFLACGSSVINHLQERKTDAIMSRTRTRPLPSHKISISQARVVALLEIITGSVLLWLSAGLLALLLGWLALVWYNAIYTNLKKITPHAVVPGSVIGSIPPLVGWVAAGGSLINLQAVILAVFFFIWQVPHFYLLAMKYGKEYEAAGLPSITSRMSLTGTKRLVFIWILITALASIVVSLSGLSASLISTCVIIAAAVWLILSFIPMLSDVGDEFKAFGYFMKINYFVLAVILMLVADPLLTGIV
jgi:protoheme IX farnesyltransferase